MEGRAGQRPDAAPEDVPGDVPEDVPEDADEGEALEDAAEGAQHRGLVDAAGDVNGKMMVGVGLVLA